MTVVTVTLPLNQYIASLPQSIWLIIYVLRKLNIFLGKKYKRFTVPIRTFGYIPENISVFKSSRYHLVKSSQAERDS